LARRAAYEQSKQLEYQDSVSEAKRVINSLSELGVNQDLLVAFRKGITALEENRLPLLHETPHPFVCRTCGFVYLSKVSAHCPVCDARPETFQRFLPIYWLERFNPQESLNAFQKTPAEIDALIDGVTEQALQQPASDGGWSIRNVLSHLQDAQQVFLYRLELMVKEEHPILASKAVFQWAASEEDRPATTFEIFQNYQKARKGLLEKLETLTFKDWQRTGFHDEFGIVSLQHQASYFATHEITHLPQIQHLRDQFGL
jgi:predicted Zn-ribbon and HTH transcriptional regulator/uncharacterized damage-inducible protein DinB